MSSTDVHKIQRRILGDMNDIISDLPEGVLLHILSLLPIEDVVRTSVLAKKWRYLWTYLSVFDFQIPYPRYDSNHKIRKNVPNCPLRSSWKTTELLEH
ncbi:putative F-box domain-containing protein [Medicago truncatula]|uniref:F-box/RNI/FBD-like domain protein n=1 Tax=Medicago truncatula TaxID=3880 RepID=A0A072UNY2_MEDTR|nr:F-box/RNI/FBD-like domain protein [Medicago truncatula]RHN61903.1 putative F-box domain-containing protein [Medicago truncatula]